MPQACWLFISKPAEEPSYESIVLLALLWSTALAFAQSGVWTVISSPNQGTKDNQLLSVAPVSASNIWAVGYEEIASGEGYVYDPLIEHWDGSSWKLAPGTNPNAGTTFLFGVTAISPTSVWAVGDTLGRSFVEKWNGTQWARVSSPNPSSANNMFLAGTALPATGDVWAVGEDFSGTSSSYRTLIEQCIAC